MKRSKKRRVVLATGAFDLLHVGHIKFLEASKKQAGPNAHLIVVVARDATVHHRKGHNPILPEKDRLKLVSSLRVVDKAMLGHKKLDLLGILHEVKPDIVSVGYDQVEIRSAVKKTIENAKLPIRVITMPKYPGLLNSSSKVRMNILKKNNS
jgi:FAD synthetase